MRFILQILIIILYYKFIKKTEGRNVAFQSPSSSKILITASDNVREMTRKSQNSINRHWQSLQIEKNIQSMVTKTSGEKTIQYHFGLPTEFILQIPQFFKLYFRKFVNFLY